MRNEVNGAHGKAFGYFAFTSLYLPRANIKTLMHACCFLEKHQYLLIQIGLISTGRQNQCDLSLVIVFSLVMDYFQRPTADYDV